MKEALIRSGEILGRHYDTLGNVEHVGIYREIIAMDPDSVVARPVAVLLARRGRRLNYGRRPCGTACGVLPSLFPTEGDFLAPSLHRINDDIE